MKPSAAQIIEAVGYIQNQETGADPELAALVQKIERYLRVTCVVVRLEMLPEIAEALQVEVGEFDFVLLSDIDSAMVSLGSSYSVQKLVEIVMLERYWAVQDPIRVAAMLDKYGSDICFFAINKKIELKEFEVFNDYFTVTEHLLTELSKLPLKMPDIASLLKDGVPVRKIISITNDLRRDGLRGLLDRVRASAEGYPKPLLDGAI